MGVDIPYLGARTAVWIVAEVHLFLAALILGAPMFVVVCEYLGVRRKDYRYERLSKEVMKMVAIAYSFTAITGVLFGFLLFVSYPVFSAFIFKKFAPVWALYGVVVLIETLLMYVYVYSWEHYSTKGKGLHIAIGVVLNIVGTLFMLLPNAVGSYMLTPPRKDIGFWSAFWNPSWSGLNLHRLIANITFGGFVVGAFAAFMFLLSDDEEDRAFYDWMGYTGNIIGTGAFMALPLAGYIYAKELFLYDATIATYFMADKEATYFVIQGLLVSMLVLIVNYYMWVSIWRVEGGTRFAAFRGPIFAFIFIALAVWILPANLLPSMTSKPPAGIALSDMVAPDRLGILTVMISKATAVTGMLLCTFLTYMIYWQSTTTGTIRWGNIAPQGQYALIALTGVIIYLMGIMGSIRELARQSWHVFNVLKDETPYWYMPSLHHGAVMTAVVTVLFFSLLAFIFWAGFLLQQKKGSEH